METAAALHAGLRWGPAGGAWSWDLGVWYLGPAGWGLGAGAWDLGLGSGLGLDSVLVTIPLPSSG